MNTVEPIRDLKKIEELKFILKRHNYRDFLMFLTGLNSGMRISDIVKLKRSDVRDDKGEMKEYITVIEKKTKKIKRFPLCNNLLEEMEFYTKNMKEDEFLFPSRKGNGPISTTQAYRIISNAAKSVNLTNIRYP